MDPKSSPVFIDASGPNFSYDYHTDPFLQYTNSSFGIPMSPSPRLSFSNLNLGSSVPEYTFSSNYTPVPSTPNRPFTPVDSISPHITNMSAANLSASELSGDGGFNSSGKRSRGTSSGRSPSPVQTSTLVHRQPLRHNHSISSTTTRASAKERPTKRRSKSDDLGSDDDDNDVDYAPSSAANDVYGGTGEHRVIQKRREEIRRQRIESEQRRRDELREGYRKLKDVLPVSNQKSSKVSLLDRATLHIKYLEMTQSQLHSRLQAAEMETQRLRLVNEKLMLGAAEHNQQAVAAAAAAHAGAAMPQPY